MTYSNLPDVIIPVSNIIFGCCNPILTEDKPSAENLLDIAYSNGFNIFDTAKVYGKSEEVLGRWIRRAGIRDRVVIVTKGCHPDGSNIQASRVNVECLKEDIESSLDRLQTDYIDIYLLHRDDPNADITALIDNLNDYMRRGIIKKIGVSNWTHTRIENANAIATKLGLKGFTVSSPQLSPAIQKHDPWGGGCVSISGDGEAEEWYRNHPEVIVFAYSCLAHGMFSGKYSSRNPIKLYKSLDYAGRKGYWCLENIKRLRDIERKELKGDYSVAQASLLWCMNRGYKVFPIATMSGEERIKKNINILEK